MLANPKSLDFFGVKGFPGVVAKSSMAAGGRGLDFVHARTGAFLALGAWATHSVSGVLAGSGEASGAVVLVCDLAGSAGGAGGAVGGISVTRRLSGASAGAGGLLGGVVVTRRLSGGSAGSGGVSGAVVITRTLSGASAGTGGAAGGLTLSLNLRASGVTALTVGEAPDRLWHEFLSYYFDGGTHQAGGVEELFPAAEILMGGARGSGSARVTITVVGELERQEVYLSEEWPGLLAGGETEYRAKDMHNRMRWRFIVRSCLREGPLTTGPNRGNAKALCRRASELLGLVLTDRKLTADLAVKGIGSLGEPSVELAVDTGVWSVRETVVRGEVLYSVRKS